MNLSYTNDSVFIQRLTEIVKTNLGNEKFGVDELVQQSGLSPHIVRKRLKTISQKTISQFINEIRLQRAMEMLQQGTVTASEVAFKAGFGSATYFNNCFHDFYGYPPGEAKKRVIRLKEVENAISDPENIAPLEEKHRSPFRRKCMVASMTLFAVTLIVFLGYFKFFNGAGKNSLNTDPKISIAVLPFTNLSDSDENKYFTDGVMEDILSNLNRIISLSVTSRTSVEQFRQTTKGVLEIARELGVRYILEGSVQRNSDKVRVRVQLIDARRDRHILSETYDRKLDDIFFIQSDIAIQVANKLEAALSPEETERIEESPTRNTEAYSLYLKGRHFWYKRTREGFEKSIEFFTKAVEVDPAYALAWAGLGDAYLYLSWYDWFEPNQKEGFEKAKEMALKAVELDNSLAEVHVLLGNIFFWSEWKWKEAEDELSLAIKLNPNYSLAQWVYAELLDVLCKRREAREHLNRALELDPVFYLPYSTSAFLYYNDGIFIESIKECRKSIELNPDYGGGYTHGWESFFHIDSFPQAIEFLQKDLFVDYNHGYLKRKYHDSVNIVFTRKGMTGVFQWLLEDKNIQLNHQYSAKLCLMIGNKEEALKNLELGFEEHQRDMVRIISDYVFIDLRSDPRYLEIVRKMGLMDYYNKALSSGEMPQ
jgi:TolB-like protein/AraC-like DNA-binding protein